LYKLFQLLAVVLCLASPAAFAQGRGGGGGRGAAPAGPPPTAKAAAPWDPTGYWVSLVTEDWRYRMFTPPKGDLTGVPVNAAGRAAAQAWDPTKETPEDACKAYGVAGLIRMPTRLHITWQDDETLKIETDAGVQTRILHFKPTEEAGGGWQGVSTASWDRSIPVMGPGRGGVPPGASLKVVTNKMKAGYLRKNGVPYSENTVVTEYIDRLEHPDGDSFLVFETEVVDPKYLATPFWTSTHFKRQKDATGWTPTPCPAR
jgi:hypothetical protein